MHLRAWGSAALLSLIIVTTFFVLTSPQSPSRAAGASMCPAIEDVSVRPLGEENYGGANESQGGRFHDHYLFDRDSKFKVGVRDEWNGSVVFAGAESNLLDDSNGARALQLAFHDDARAVEGCAGHAACLDAKSRFHACGSATEFPGWNATQGPNACGNSAEPLALEFEKSVLHLSFSPSQANPAWRGGDCVAPEKACATSAKIESSGLRVHQSLRFVRAGVVEIEYYVTNPEDRVITARKGPRHEFPRLFAAEALTMLHHVKTREPADKRRPAAEQDSEELLAENGWLSFANRDGSRALGLLWENRNGEVLVRANAKTNQVQSNFGFDIPAGDSLRGRVYMLMGDAATVSENAIKLERELPPFGRIEENEIQEDTRTVSLKGWALDNKSVRRLELFVDGKKVEDLKLNAARADVCAKHPGYGMCAKNQTVGFEANYARPQGRGCDKIIEIKATDDDGNSRVIARSGIRPVASAD